MLRKQITLTPLLKPFLAYKAFPMLILHQQILMEMVTWKSQENQPLLCYQVRQHKSALVLTWNAFGFTISRCRTPSGSRPLGSRKIRHKSSIKIRHKSSTRLTDTGFQVRLQGSCHLLHRVHTAFCKELLILPFQFLDAL